MNKPTINPGSKNYDGNISVTISVEEGCTFYYKWGSRFYSSKELQTASVKKVDDTSTTLTIKGKTSDRYLSAIAVKDNNGTKFYSEATQVKYTYLTSSKKDLTITSPDFAINVNGVLVLNIFDVVLLAVEFILFWHGEFLRCDEMESRIEVAHSCDK